MHISAPPRLRSIRPGRPWPIWLSPIRLAVIVPAWFLAVYLWLAWWNPDFHHTVDPISTLGGVGQPRAALWNLVGFIAPGAVIVAFGWNLKSRFRPSWIGEAAGMSLAISGFLMAMAGVFPTSIGQPTWVDTVHQFSGWGALAAFLVAGVLTPGLLWSRLGLRWGAVGPLALVLGTLAYQVLGADQWWLGQRVGFACYFLWMSLIALVVTSAFPPSAIFESPGVPGLT